MVAFAEQLKFEDAGKIRDKIKALKKLELVYSEEIA